MTNELCKHELHPSECSACKRPKAVPPVTVRLKAFEAKYNSRCEECGDQIFPGQEIVRRSTASVAYSHLDCDDVMIAIL